MPSEQDLINHIVDAGRRIGRYAAGKSYNDFLREELLQDGIVRQLEIIHCQCTCFAGGTCPTLSFRTPTMT
jgi:hypothetical protein